VAIIGGVREKLKMEITWREARPLIYSFRRSPRLSKKEEKVPKPTKV